MSEYIIHAVDAKTLYENNTDYYFPLEAYLREKIVRCRDCRYYDTHTELPECYREVPGRIVAPDGFCAWGERRDNKE